jgi:hypothetical protein
MYRTEGIPHSPRQGGDQCRRGEWQLRRLWRILLLCLDNYYIQVMNLQSLSFHMPNHCRHKAYLTLAELEPSGNISYIKENVKIDRLTANMGCRLLRYFNRLTKCWIVWLVLCMLVESNSNPIGTFKWKLFLFMGSWFEVLQYAFPLTFAEYQASCEHDSWRRSQPKREKCQVYI